MLDEHRLYWDPKSNLLFFPDFETEASCETQPRGFVVERFYPKENDDYPSFEAVYLARFGRWDTCGCCFRESILKKLVNFDDSGYQDADVRTNFRKFVEEHPEFRSTRFAAKEECIEGVPKEAICVPEA